MWLEMYIENMDLGPLDSKRLLFYTLRGRALNYAVSMDESNPGIGYRDLMRQMKVRFGAEIRCETATSDCKMRCKREGRHYMNGQIDLVILQQSSDLRTRVLKCPKCHGSYALLHGMQR